MDRRRARERKEFPVLGFMKYNPEQVLHRDQVDY